MDKLDDVFLHQIAAPGLPGNISAAEAAAIRSDQARLLARAEIAGLGDVPDVTITDPAEGQTIIRDDQGRWVNGAAVGAIERVETGGSPDQVVATRVSSIVFKGGLRAREPSPPLAGHVVVEALTGGSGASSALAKEDHVHTQYVDVSIPIPASGSLSSGTRTLVTQTLGFAPDRAYIVTAILELDLRGEGSGAGRSTPRVTLGASTVGRSPSARTVAGVDRPAMVRHPGVVLTNQSQLTVAASIQFSSGDPVYVDGGHLTIQLKPYR